MNQAQTKKLNCTQLFQTIRDIPVTGVAYAVDEVFKLGYWNGNPEWCNLGQGQSEVGDIKGAPPRISEIKIEPSDQAYRPIGGTAKLKQVIADYYNRLYRQNKRQTTHRQISASRAVGGLPYRVYLLLWEKLISVIKPQIIPPMKS